MLVYDITQEKTFDNIAKWLRNIDEVTYYIIMLFTFTKRYVNIILNLSQFVWCENLYGSNNV